MKTEIDHEVALGYTDRRTYLTFSFNNTNLYQQNDINLYTIKL